MTYKFDVLGTINMKVENEREIQNFIDSIKDIKSNIIFDSNINDIKSTLDNLRDKTIKVIANLDSSNLDNIKNRTINVDVNIRDAEVRNLESKLKNLSTKITTNLKIGAIDFDTKKAKSQIKEIESYLENLQKKANIDLNINTNMNKLQQNIKVDMNDISKSKPTDIKVSNADIGKAVVANVVFDNIVNGMTSQTESWEELFRRLAILGANKELEKSIVASANNLHIELGEMNQLMQYMTPKSIEMLEGLNKNGDFTQKQMDELIALGWKAENIQSGGFDDIIRGLQSLPPELRDSRNDLIAYMNIANKNIEFGNTEVGEQIRNLAPVFDENTLKVASLLTEISDGTDTANTYSSQLLDLYEKSGNDWDKFNENLEKLKEGQQIEGIEITNYKELADALREKDINISKSMELNIGDKNLIDNTNALKDNTGWLKQIADSLNQIGYNIGGKGTMINMDVATGGIAGIAGLILSLKTYIAASLILASYQKGKIGYYEDLSKKIKVEAIVKVKKSIDLKNLLKMYEELIEAFEHSIKTGTDAKRIENEAKIIKDLKREAEIIKDLEDIDINKISQMDMKDIDKFYNKINKINILLPNFSGNINEFRQVLDNIKYEIAVNDSEIAKAAEKMLSLKDSISTYSKIPIFNELTDMGGWLIKIIMKITNGLSKIKNIFGGSSKGTMFGAAINPEAVKSTVKLIKGFKKVMNILNKIKPILKVLGKAFAGLGLVIMPLIQLLEGDLKGAITHLKLEIAELLLWPLGIGELIAGIIMEILKFFGIIDDGFNGARAGMLTLMAILQSLAAFITGDWSGVQDSLKQAFEELGSSADEANQLAQQTVENWKNIPNAILEGITNSIAGITEAFNNWWDEQSKWWSEKIAEYKNYGSELIQNFIDGIKAKYADLKSAVNSIADTVHDYLGHTTPAKGALSDDDKWGVHFMDNFVGGMEAKIPNLQNAVNKSTNTLSAINTIPANNSNYGDIHINVVGNGFNEQQLAQKISNILKKQQFR